MSFPNIIKTNPVPGLTVYTPIRQSSNWATRTESQNKKISYPKSQKPNNKIHPEPPENNEGGRKKKSVSKPKKKKMTSPKKSTRK